MITVLPLKDQDQLRALYEEQGQAVTQTSEAVVAADGEEILGFCLFDIDSEKISIGQIKPVDDLALADGILRSALHVAISREILNAVYTSTASEELLKRLDFIKNDGNQGVKIEKLFSICQNCKE